MLWLEGSLHHERAVLNGHSVRKVETHCFRPIALGPLSCPGSL